MKIWHGTEEELSGIAPLETRRYDGICVGERLIVKVPQSPYSSAIKTVEVPVLTLFVWDDEYIEATTGVLTKQMLSDAFASIERINIQPVTWAMPDVIFPDENSLEVFDDEDV